MRVEGVESTASSISAVDEFYHKLIARVCPIGGEIDGKYVLGVSRKDIDMIYKEVAGPVCMSSFGTGASKDDVVNELKQAIENGTIKIESGAEKLFAIVNSLQN